MTDRPTSDATEPARAAIWRDLLAVLLILTVAPMVALAATWAYTAASGAGDAGVLRPGILAERLALQSVVYFAALHGAVLVLTLLAAKALHADAGQRLGLSTPHLTPNGMLRAALLLLVPAALWLWCLARLMPEALAAEQGDFSRFVRSGEGALLFPVLTLLAPVAEEVLFRGFLLHVLQRTPFGFWGSAVLSSLLWAALHVGTSIWLRAHLVLAGIGLAWLVRRTGGLRLAIFLHVLFNTSLGLLLVLLAND